MGKKPYERKTKKYTSLREEWLEKNPSIQRYIDGEQIHEDNPYKEFLIKTEGFWETEGIILDFLIQFLSGYIWACENDINMIAYHRELGEVKNLLSECLGYTKMVADGKDSDFMYGERFVPWALVRLAILQPAMWD